MADASGLTAAQLHGDNMDPHVADLIVELRPASQSHSWYFDAPPETGGLSRMMWRPDVAHAFLVDSGSSSKYGGTGQTFDWQTNGSRLKDCADWGGLSWLAGLIRPMSRKRSVY